VIYPGYYPLSAEPGSYGAPGGELFHESPVGLEFAWEPSSIAAAHDRSRSTCSSATGVSSSLHSLIWLEFCQKKKPEYSN